MFGRRGEGGGEGAARLKGEVEIFLTESRDFLVDVIEGFMLG